MSRLKRRIKDTLKYGTVHGLLHLGKFVSMEQRERSGRVISKLAGITPTVRRKIRRNMDAALGEGSFPGAEVEYLRNLGRWASYAIQIYHRGLMHSGVPEWIVFDESIQIVKDVMDAGKGAIYAVPHLFGHEMSAGLLARKFPTVGLVRESKYEPHNKVKQHFYEESGGTEVIYRPRRGSVAADMRVCMRTLKQGKGLMITPDLLDSSSKGTTAHLLGHAIRLKPGIVGLSMFTGAPVVRMFLYWDDEHIRVYFDEPRYFKRNSDPELTTIEGMQWWCDGLAAHLKTQPTTWHFWLDRSWSRVWQTPNNQRT